MPVITIDTDDAVTVAQFAKENELSRQAVWNWAARYPDFPKPLLLSKYVRVYSRRALAAWLEGVG